MNNNTGPRKIILFIPGYYGSRLADKKTSKIRWANIFDFFLSQKGIATSVVGTNITELSELTPIDVLREVSIIPYFFKIDSYGKTLSMLEKFASKEQMILETVAYDWRDDFLNSIKLIDKKIKNLALTSSDELYVVSHSTGSLLLSYYLRYGIQDLDSVVKENWEGLKYITKAVLAAAPFHGLMVLLRDMEHGTTKGLNKNLMSARDYSSFKSSYMFIPPMGEDLGVDSKNQTEISLDLHNPQSWENNNWGIFKFIRSSEKEAAKNFIETCMSRSQKFHELLRAPIQIMQEKKMPLLYTWGGGHKTVQRGFVSDKKSGGLEKNIIFTLKESFVEGDGTVTADSGKPLEYLKSLDLTIVPTRLSHLGVVASKENQKMIQEFILKK